jgi:hypothetical protein
MIPQSDRWFREMFNHHIRVGVGTTAMIMKALLPSESLVHCHNSEDMIFAVTKDSSFYVCQLPYWYLPLPMVVEASGGRKYKILINEN